MLPETASATWGEPWGMGDQATIKFAEASASTASASTTLVPARRVASSFGAPTRFALFFVVPRAFRLRGVRGGLDPTIAGAPLVVVVVATRRNIVREAGSLGPSPPARLTRL